MLTGINENMLKYTQKYLTIPAGKYKLLKKEPNKNFENEKLTICNKNLLKFMDLTAE